MMWVRMILVAVLAVALVGPSPVQGARELATLAKERIMEWTNFAHRARAAAETVKQALEKANRQIAKR
jgi:hypothetical protein